MKSTKPLAMALALALPAAIAAVPLVADTTVVAPQSDAVVLAIEHLAASLGEEDVVGAIVTDEYTSQHNGVTHVYLRQTVGGLEVLGAEATVNVKGDVVAHAAHRMIDDIADVASGVEVVSAGEAVLLGAASVSALPELLQEAPGLAYQVTDDGRVRLAWSFQIFEDHDWWNLSVDAETGEILYTANWVDHENRAEVAARTVRDEHAHTVADALDIEVVLPPVTVDDGSTYRVFPMPFESPIDTEATHQIVATPADAIASPFGWHDLDGEAGHDTTITKGNNVNAYTDAVQTGHSSPAGVGVAVPSPVEHNQADGGEMLQPQGGDGLDFDFTVPSFDLHPYAFRDAAVTNLFYWNNVMHDVTYRYGFDEAAGNFQTKNYTGEGAGNDAVNAEAQDGAGVLNANFGTPADGTPGRMQMFLWVDAFRDLPQAGMQTTRQDRSAQVRDGDFDGGVIAHEYGHGISNRLVGGPSNVDCLRSHDERQGEGWSDFWSYALTMRPGDDGATPRGIGNYVIYYDSVADETGDVRQAPGIRITPYSTDMDDLEVNPSTYDTIRGAAEPHGVGYVWATMLWDMYWNLVDVHGFNPNPYESWDTGGNNLAIQLTVDGMKFAPCEPGFEDARDAIIAADGALTGDGETMANFPDRDADGNVRQTLVGENFCLIWDTFARRGLGFDADQGDPASKVDGEEGFRSHPDC